MSTRTKRSFWQNDSCKLGKRKVYEYSQSTINHLIHQKSIGLLKLEEHCFLGKTVLVRLAIFLKAIWKYFSSDYMQVICD